MGSGGILFLPSFFLLIITTSKVHKIKSPFLLFPHSCLLSLRACLSLASNAALVSNSSSSCRRMRTISSWEASHCSLRVADSTLSCVAAVESCSLRSRHCTCILLASFRRDSTLTATDSHWSWDMFWTEGKGHVSCQTVGCGLIRRLKSADMF